MKKNTDISDLLLNNVDEFKSEFFSRFELRNAPSPLKLTNNINKNYLFPTFYSDVSCSIGVFLCDYQAALKLLPNKAMKPIRMPFNRALMTVSCYEYKKVLGVAPYNEIAFSIPIQVNPTLDIPLLPMIAEKLFTRFGYHVFHMPVTSLENQIRGLKIWGLPKVVNDIDISINEFESQITTTDENGHDYFQLKIPTQGKNATFDVKSNLYSELNKQLMQSQTCFTGSFNVTKNIAAIFSKHSKNKPSLMLGEGPMADKLRTLKINPTPIQTRFCKKMQACFDLPVPYKT